MHTGGCRCGFAGERWPGEMHFPLCSFGDSTDLAPTTQAYTEERLPWMHLAPS